MATTGSAAAKPSRSDAVAVGVFLAVCAVLIFSLNRLKHPYYEIEHLVGYVFMFGLVIYQLRACYRVATTAAPRGKLHMVSFFLGLKALADVVNLELLFKSGDPRVVRILTDIGMFLALYFALGLVETLLQKPAATPPEGDWDRVTPPAV